ncbi:GntR family transcriptional regulator [Lactobacillus pasteurii DSM 23907 = CRBIP 24.76]|uniref:UbiC transcription regulator-associated n=1 Tax=Lactobacillus pasteurii DSM 23907 = CRBIP 24.76 TaxID=1423790 RepID=I7IZX7_9LACO|nr:GntR family transcriptional regulator [Lactobacillus pasteurii]KRK08641.1 GntR family transcriptional regulator [Lactobacillus pasteurii DSM 23907 = CRBIP 24.76]TDG76536.1 hypothetical protein C5L33_001295 [Lactobacillus pasteurii]CCI85372.1 UbiC transcription regulator-associated [Lactobacillus pasteurii DSM 23907 = CRBIP 24.76]
MTKSKYLIIAEKIREKIQQGVYQPNTILPDQETLAQEMNVSRLTVKKALDGLERQGIVYKQSGLGTFVAGDTPIKDEIDAPSNFFTGLGNELGKDRIKSKVLNFTVEFPDQAIQKNLSLKKNEPVYNITRLRLLDDEPYILEYTFMPVKLVPDLDEKVLHDSIYNYIHHKLHLKFGRAYRKIKAVRSEENDLLYLQADKNDPLLELEQIVWLTNGQPIEYSRSRSRFDRRAYTVVENNRF